MPSKYRVVNEPAGSPKALEDALNEHAGEGYKCVHVESNPDGSWLLVLETEVREYIID